MKKYITPVYEIQKMETNDIVLSSVGSAVSIEQLGAETNASVSLNSLLGLR